MREAFDFAAAFFGELSQQKVAGTEPPKGTERLENIRNPCEQVEPLKRNFGEAGRGAHRKPLLARQTEGRPS